MLHIIIAWLVAISAVSAAVCWVLAAQARVTLHPELLG